jgi:dimethylargininase
MFKSAIVRVPGPNFAAGLTSAGLGKPDFDRALVQHQRYCAALAQCGLALIPLEADAHYPDSTFVEDTAILTLQGAIVTRPGAESRRGEIASMQVVLDALYPSVSAITAPGTLDGGDICQTDQGFLIGITERTNEAGAQQLVELLAQQGYTARYVDIRGIAGLLHLKSGLSYLGNNQLVIVAALADHPAFKDYDLIVVTEGEEYAANCLRINDYVVLAAGFPMLQSTIETLGYPVIALEMSEFQKMDGGLSCLSLRF